MTMKVFVLNLERANQRRKFMKNQLDQLNVNYELIRGIDYKELSEDDYSQLCSPRAATVNPYLRGVFAASLSHLHIYRAIVDQGCELNLVLEDDVILPPNIQEIMQELRGKVKDNMVILLRYYSHKNFPLRLTTTNSMSCGLAGSLLAPVDINQVASAAAYIINIDFAKRALDSLYPVDHVPDDWSTLYDKGIFTTLYCLHPQPIKDAPFTPIVEYPSTRTIFARLKRLVRRCGAVNRLAGIFTKQSNSNRHLIEITNDQPFWN